MGVGAVFNSPPITPRPRKVQPMPDQGAKKQLAGVRLSRKICILPVP
jgi:hypothetical protein